MSVAAITAGALGKRMEEIVGPDGVEQDPSRLASFAIDGVTPAVVVTPAGVQQTCEILGYANAQRLVVVPAGGFTQQGTGAIPERIDIVLRTTHLAAVEHYDPGDLTIGIGAGTTIAAVESLIGEHRQLLPLDVAKPGRSTVGGVLATAAHGPLKHACGGARDFCIGVRFVTADGKFAKGGGRVVKNVAGYDLMKLLIGSYGTLAVIVGASFKLFPAPRQTCTFVCDFERLDQTIGFRDRIMHSKLAPLSLEVVSEHAQPILAAENVDGWRILLRAAGSDAVLGRYRKELGSAVSREVNGATEANWWRDIADFPATVMDKWPNAMLLRVDLPPSAALEVLQGAERVALENNFIPAIVGRIGVTALITAFIPVAVDPPAAMQYVSAVSAFRSGLGRDSSAVVLQCPVEAKRHFSVWGSSPTDVAPMRAIKKALDENNILNRGRFLF